MMLTAAVFVFISSGLAVLKIIEWHSPIGLGFFAKTALSFMLGLGVISLQLFLYSLSGVPFGFIQVALPWLIVLPALFIRQFGKGPVILAFKFGLSRPGLFEAALISMILVQVVYVFAFIFTLPITRWDAFLIWFLKAKAFYLDGGVNSAFFFNGSFAYSHHDYPLLLPLSITWIYTALGGADDTLAKVIYPLAYLSLLSIFHFTLKDFASKRAALLFTALLSLTPIVLVHSAGFLLKIGPLNSGDFVGYADIILSVYFLGAGSFLYLYSLKGDKRYLVLSALFLAMGAWTKNEGLPFAGLGFLAIAVNTAGGDRKWALRALAFAIIAAFNLPWAVYKKAYGLHSEYTGNITAAVIGANLGRLKLIFGRSAEYLFLTPSLFSFAWYAYFASLTVNLRANMKKPLATLNALVLLQFSTYVFVYVITPLDLEWHLGTSLERLLLHLLPLSMLIAAVNIAGARREPAEAVLTP